MPFESLNPGTASYPRTSAITKAKGTKSIEFISFTPLIWIRWTLLNSCNQSPNQNKHKIIACQVIASTHFSFKDYKCKWMFEHRLEQVVFQGSILLYIFSYFSFLFTGMYYNLYLSRKENKVNLKFQANFVIKVEDKDAIYLLCFLK